MIYAFKYKITDEPLEPFVTKLYRLILLILPPALKLQKFMECGAMQSDPGCTRGSRPSKRRSPLFSSLSSPTYLSSSIVGDYHHMRGAPEHKLCCYIYIRVLGPNAVTAHHIKSVQLLWSGAKAVFLPSPAQHVASLQQPLQVLRTGWKEIWCFLPP